MEIVLAADHNGWELKNQLVLWLKEKQIAVIDVGANSLEPNDDYPDYAVKAAETVAQSPDNRRGVLICGTGIGMSVAANKVKGVRAANLNDTKMAETAQRDGQINILTLGAKFISFSQAQAVIEAWLNTPFSAEERHQRRIRKISDYEKNN